MGLGFGDLFYIDDADTQEPLDVRFVVGLLDYDV